MLSARPMGPASPHRVGDPAANVSHALGRPL
jgi:hypothetical protein